MSSPYSTGGGGTQFETRVVAYYAAAVLAESAARALPGLQAKQVLTQRGDFGEPLDDVIVSGISDDGRTTKLSLQVKSSLRFTEADSEWVAVLGQAWATFTNDEFDTDLHRLGVVISSYHARADKYYQSVLTWAEHSPSAQDFLQRIALEDFSHHDQRSFVETTRRILDKHHGSAVDDERLWQFLRVFRILYFDFQTEASSRDAELAIDRIRRALEPEKRGQAINVWNHLITRAGNTAPVGGGDTRATLLASMVTEGLPTIAGESLWADIQKVGRESERALSMIKADIHGLRLNRHTAYDAVMSSLSAGRFIQIDGEPGSGKSALLKQIATEHQQFGPVFVLKDQRISPRGWAAHANQLNITDNLAALLGELACVGPAIVFIDGIDKIADPAVQLTVNDVVRAIACEPSLSDWKILATVREQNLEHLATWLDPDALKLLPIKTVTVSPLGSGELKIVTAAFPRLRPILLETENADVILRRPFFLDSIIRLAGREGTEELPASEAELLKLWWELGGSDDPNFASAQDRRNSLMELAERFLAEPSRPIPIRDIPAGALESLKTAGVLRDANLGHTVAFTHDIYEEWALCEWLMNRLPQVAAAIRSVGEPQELVRPLQLLGSYLLETEQSDDAWRDLYADCGQDDLRPIWQRTLLTSCLRSTRSTHVLNKLSAFLAENDHDVLKKLLNALQTLEVVPNAMFLDEKALPSLEPEERVKFAQLAAWPKLLTWVRFFDWFFASEDDPVPALVPVLVPVFNTWQSYCAGQNIRHCGRIGEIAGRWLTEFEEALHPDHFRDLRNPLGLSLRYEDESALEDSIRTLFLSSAGDVPDSVAEYLRDKTGDRLSHMHRDKILAASNGIARHLPTELVDYIVAVFLSHPKDDARRVNHPGGGNRELGLVGHGTFYPASPLQAPFLALLRQHEAEGLRLVKTICNHSIGVWRWLRERPDYSEEGVTPLAVKFDFPWGTQSFWGDHQVYSWFRGGWGNHACQSGLMALEHWAFERIEAGDDFDTVLRRVLEGNESVAALGLVVSLCIAHLDKSMDVLVEFITCPQIWNWDLSRSVTDRTGNHANEIGDWSRYRHLMIAVRELNQRPHRHIYIRDLVPYFVFSDREELKRRYTDAVRTMPERLPFEFEEQKNDEAYTESLSKSVSWMVEQADPQYWHSEPMEDGRIKFWNDPPSADAPDRQRVIRSNVLMERFLRLALWAQKCLEEDKLRDDVPLGEALSEARDLDCDDIFEPAGNDFQASQRAAAIAGVAFVLARFADEDLWGVDASAWVTKTIRRASAYADNDDFTYRGSALSMHPLIFAVHGNAALIVRNFDRERCQIELLKLALHPFESVAAAVAKTISRVAKECPAFGWELFAVLVRRCIVTESERPNYHSLEKAEDEDRQHARLIDDAISALDANTPTTLPSIPMPWLLIDGDERAARLDPSLYVRNTELFHWHIAEKTILEADVSVLISDPDQRRQFLGLLEQLIEMTFQEMVPPFADSRRDHRGNIPFEWVFGFFHWLGRTCQHLSKQEIEEVILPRILEAESESALMAMENFGRAYLGYLVLPPAELTDDRFEIWERIADWIIENSEGQRQRHVDREFAHCLFLTLFCFTRDFQPLVCVVDRGWAPLTRFEPIIERVIERYGTNETLFLGVAKFLQRGGLDLAPDPALNWLKDIAVAMKADQHFWSANGDETVDVLKEIIGQRAESLTEAHRQTISLITDILVDNGVRGAGFLQQDQLRA